MGRLGRALPIAVMLLVVPGAPLLAAPDEIQVYLDDINAPREVGLEVHLNYVPQGRKTADYPGEIPPHHVFRATPEISLGIAPNWDVGVYLPSELAPGGNVYMDRVRGRIKYLAPVAQTRPWFYGINLEVGNVPLRVSEDRYVAELRSIAGYRAGKWLFAVNPTLGWALSGPNRSSTPEFDLSVKVARQVSDAWAVGVEHYAGFGPINDTLPGSAQDQVLFLALDYEHKGFGVNFGVGRGLTNASDTTVVKAILSIPID